jgi:hypothetical protein
MNRPNLTANAAVRQAGMTVSGYLASAIESIDGQFGAGYATSNPALVAAFIHAATLDFNNCAMHSVLGEIADAISELAHRIGEPADTAAVA